MTLFDVLDRLPTNHTPQSIEARFEAFHRTNPQVYVQLRRFARQAVAAGRTRLGMKELFERLRWWSTVETQSTDGFKLNNVLTSRYARLLMREPEFAGLFETRILKAA